MFRLALSGVFEMLAPQKHKAKKRSQCALQENLLAKRIISSRKVLRVQYLAEPKRIDPDRPLRFPFTQFALVTAAGACGMWVI